MIADAAAGLQHERAARQLEWAEMATLPRRGCGATPGRACYSTNYSERGCALGRLAWSLLGSILVALAAACGGDEPLQNTDGSGGGSGLENPCANSEPVACVRSCTDFTSAGSGVCRNGPYLECPEGTVDPSTCTGNPCEDAKAVTCVFSCADQTPVAQPYCAGGPAWTCPDGSIDLASCR